MRVWVNGEAMELAEGTTVLALLEERRIPRRYLAVEVNGRILSPEEHAHTVLREGDRVEIVTLVGGGAGGARGAERS